MEKRLGRPLAEGEVIHHLNYKPWDDNEDNLVLVSREQHARIPHLMTRFIEERGLLGAYREWLLQKLQEQPDREEVLMLALVSEEGRALRLQKRIARLAGEAEAKLDGLAAFDSLERRAQTHG